MFITKIYFLQDVIMLIFNVYFYFKFLGNILRIVSCLNYSSPVIIALDRQ